MQDRLGISAARGEAEVLQQPDHGAAIAKGEKGFAALGEQVRPIRAWLRNRCIETIESLYRSEGRAV